MGDGRESTRQRILDAGVSLWGEEAPAELFAGLSVARISRMAGVTRTTFYAYWESTEEYLLDLTRHLSVPGLGADPKPAGPAVDALTSAGSELVNRFLEACDRYMMAMVDDPRLRLRLGLQSKMDDPEIADGLRAVVHETEAIRSRIFARQLPTWGRWNRSPLEGHHVHAILTAMAEGLAVRHVLEPERFPVRLYGLAALSLLIMLTARRENDRSLYDVLEVANDWASSATDRPERVAPNPGTPLSDEDVRRLILEARRLASVSGWEDVSLSGVALLSGMPEARVMEAFGSKAGLAMAIFLFNVSARQEDLVETDDPLADLRSMLAVSVDELRRSPVFSQSMVAILSGTMTFATPSNFAFDPHVGLEAAVGRAQAAGALDPTLDTAELASVLGRTLLLSNLPMTRTFGTHVDAIELVLRGAGAAPRTD